MPQRWPPTLLVLALLTGRAGADEPTAAALSRARAGRDTAPGDALGARLGDRWHPVGRDGTLADRPEGAADGGDGG